MAIGAITTIGDWTAIELLASITAANGAPSTEAHGLSTDQIKSAFGGIIPTDLSLLIMSTAGSGVMTCTASLWAGSSTIGGVTSGWGKPGIGATSSVKGLINAGQTIDEVSADKIWHVEPVGYIAHFARVFLEITAIAGTATAVTGFLIGGRRYGSY